MLAHPLGKLYGCIYATHETCASRRPKIFQRPQSKRDDVAEARHRLVDSECSSFYRSTQLPPAETATTRQGFVSCVMLAELGFACGIGGHGLSQPVNHVHDKRRSADVVSPLFLVGVVCASLGGLLRKWSYQVMGRHFTFQLSILKDHQLITDGPYAYVRHPGYTALILTFFGMSACQLSAGSWRIETRVFDSVFGKCIGLLGVCAALQLILVVSRAPAEDRMLHEQFGDQWEEWAKKVPYKCIPGIW